MIRQLLSRIGCLIWSFGGIVLVVGIAAEQSGQPGLEILLVGLVVAVVGFLIWNWMRPKRQRNTRFSLFRKRNQENEVNENRQNNWEDRYFDD